MATSYRCDICRPRSLTSRQIRTSSHYHMTELQHKSTNSLPRVLGQNGSGQNGTDKMVWTKWYTDKMSLDKMARTKWYGQNGMDKMVYGQNVIGQNGTDKMVRTKWYE